jgi:hypothetical protein
VNTVVDSNSWRQWLWRVRPSGLYRRVVRKNPGVSEEHVSSIWVSQAIRFLLADCFLRFYCLAYFSTLKMEAICFSEMSGCLRTTQRHNSNLWCISVRDWSLPFGIRFSCTQNTHWLLLMFDCFGSIFRYRSLHHLFIIIGWLARLTIRFSL